MKFVKICFLLLLIPVIGCVTTQTEIRKEKEIVYVKPAEQMTVESFEAAGKWWGHYLKGTRPGTINGKFVEAIIDDHDLKYFKVHSDLKEAFKKGFRFGYEDRVADLVLGPNIQEAAGRIGIATSEKFVKVIENFEKGWAETLHDAVYVFITLIAEGSQADREQFIKDFIKIYSKKYEDTQKIIKAGTTAPLMAEEGILLHIDVNKTIGALNIPVPDSLKKEIYRQAFKTMGYEMGHRYSHNLIKRNDLIDWLRRSKTALNMDRGEPINQKLIAENLKIIEESFCSKESYGTDAKSVFDGLCKEAGY